MWFESQKCLCHFIFIEIQNCLRKGAFSFIYPRKFPLTDELHNYVWEYRWSFRQTQSWCCLALDNIISWVLTSPPPLPSLNTPSILGSRAGLKGGESVGEKGTGTGERRAGKNWFFQWAMLSCLLPSIVWESRSHRGTLSMGKSTVFMPFPAAKIKT